MTVVRPGGGPLLLLPGDPRGIGPEVLVRTLAQRRGRLVRPVVVVGDRAAIEVETARYGVEVDVWDPPGGEPVEAAAIRMAAEACLRGDAAGMVTGPIHKARLAARGFAFTGHTDFLGHLCGVEPVMAFVGGSLTVALATVHLPLRAVPDALTVPGLLHVVRASHAALRDQLGVARPRVVVCGLNPHAGDGGVLGTEEITVVGPAVEAARGEGIDAIGPISAESAFRIARGHDDHVVVAMYHDQGLAPLKLVDFGRSVNWTLGLPFVRTSVDHGTADDIAGRGVADPASFDAALALAERLTAR